jgi:hypothetical protein
LKDFFQSQLFPAESQEFIEKFLCIPQVYCRSLISCSLLDETAYKEILELSNNGHIFEIGAGSGYNARVLEMMGAEDLYLVDTDTNRFPVQFMSISDGGAIDKQRLRDIASNNGAALYIWPEFDHHYLKDWLDAGGKRVITCGCYHEDHFRPGKPICPSFPPPSCPIDFKLVKSHEPPHYDKTDPSTHDILQFWEV